MNNEKKLFINILNKLIIKNNFLKDFNNNLINRKEKILKNFE